MNSRAHCIKCKSQLWKDHRFFKLIFIVFCSWLIVEEFYTFFIVKPTHTSQAIRKFVPEDFPEILLCPEPSIDMNVARSKGYEGIQEYFLGTGTDDFETPHLMGWGGNKSEDVGKVSDDIEILNNVTEDCPHGAIWSQNNDDGGEIKFNLTKALYPYHRCCKVIPPDYSKLLFSMVMVSSGEGVLRFKMKTQKRRNSYGETTIKRNHKQKM